MNAQYIFKQPFSKDEIENYYDFRWQQLRKPLNAKEGSEIDDNEDISYHLMVLNRDKKIIGIGRLHKIDDYTGQVRYMAVDEAFQNEGIGSEILVHLEKEVKSRGCEVVILHARESAINFYEKNGYKRVKKTHKIMGEIQHFLMQKEII